MTEKTLFSIIFLLILGGICLNDVWQWLKSYILSRGIDYAKKKES